MGHSRSNKEARDSDPWNAGGAGWPTDDIENARKQWRELPGAEGSKGFRFQLKLPSLRHYTVAWIIISLFMAYEYTLLNGVHSGPSALRWLHRQNLLLSSPQKLSPESGGALSYRLGWLGFIIICLTNTYVLRKRWRPLKDMGRVSDWLNFHIFCGLVGPTLILFHCNFKVGGLVAVSFWSMIISFASGIVGRYFYLQILAQRVDYKRALQFYEAGFKECQKRLKTPLSDNVLSKLKDYSLLMAGGTPAVMAGTASLPSVLLESLAGDLRFLIHSPPIPPGLPRSFPQHLKRYAVLRRRFATAAYYKRLMGYWHTFHMPFAIFMYAVVIIHIIAALVFRVN